MGNGILLITLVAVVCTLVAAVLAFRDKKGWGWFLLAATFIASAVAHVLVEGGA